LTTEEQILQAATKVFTEKGFAAARMDEIAKEAGINRALLHYYFRSKEKMFEIIFEDKFRSFFAGIYGILSSDLPILEKIAAVVDHELQTLVKHPEIPIFILNEINVNPERMIRRIHREDASIPEAVKMLDAQIQKEFEQGIIKRIGGFSLVIEIMSLCIYPFVAKNLIMGVTGMDREAFLQFALSRKQEIIGILQNGIKL
jgi:AcrR family transcriptional regulator